MPNKLFVDTIQFKLLERFFLLKKTESLKSISVELNLSAYTVRTELSRLERLELIVGNPIKGVIFYEANKMHVNYNEMPNILKTYI